MTKYVDKDRLYILEDGEEDFAVPESTPINTLGFTVLGNTLKNHITGTDGHDFLDGGLGADTMSGGLGNDCYYVDDKNDVVVEQANGGSDIVRTLIENFDLSKTPFIEDLMLMEGVHNASGSSSNNVIYGNNIDNHLDGMADNDILYGGSGNDFLDGGTGNDYMAGGFDNDCYYVDSRSDTVVEAANGGSDIIRALIDYDLRWTNNVEDLMLMEGVHKGTGDNSHNVIYGNNLENALIGLGGNDILYGGDGRDKLSGGQGNDWLDGGFARDTMDGGAGNDCYIVHNADDIVIEAKNGGSDIIRTFVEGYDLGKVQNVEDLMPMEGVHEASGSNGDNVIYGNNLTNFLQGKDGADILYGGSGDDVLKGDDGNDLLDGGFEADVLWGGKGTDVFRFSSALSTLNADDICDFEHGEDKIWLDHRIFEKLGFTGKAHELDAKYFFIDDGSAKQGKDQVLVYTDLNGAGRLVYDADGNGAGKGIVFTTLGGHHTGLSSSDIIVY